MDANLNIKNVFWNSSKNKVEKIVLESGEVMENEISKVATPTLTLDLETEKVTIATTTSDAKILYKKNTGSWTLYSSAVSVADKDKIQAYAVAPSIVASGVAELTASIPDGEYY